MAHVLVDCSLAAISPFLFGDAHREVLIVPSFCLSARKRKEQKVALFVAHGRLEVLVVGQPKKKSIDI